MTSEASSFRAHHPSRVRRSILTVPAINDRALDKLTSLDCDAVIFDLEDSVAESLKAEARRKLMEFLQNSDLKHRECIIRINAAETVHFGEDMKLVLQCVPDAVLLPKVEEPVTVQDVADMIGEQDAAEGLRIWAMIETPRGVLNSAAIASSGRTSNSRLDAFVIGLNDLRKATGIPAAPGRTYLVPYLLQVLLAARAYGLDVIDSVSNDFREIESFAAECAQGRAMGFDGKMLIHPAQIEPANHHFGPSHSAIAEARFIVGTFSDPAHAGLNVINIDGRMIERLHAEEAARLLAKLALIDARKDKP
jgi:citrate lyase subunit beta / citryl-CoA lyase